MNKNAQRLLIFSGIGFLMAVSIITSMSTIPIIFPTAMANTGTLIVKITDAPVELSTLLLTIDGVEVQNESGDWTSVPLVSGGDEGLQFDLLEFESTTMDASISELEAGEYNSIRMSIKAASARLIDSEIDITLRVPSEKIKVFVPFTIEQGEDTTVILDIQVDSTEMSIAIANNTEHNLRPVVKATVIDP